MSIFGKIKDAIFGKKAEAAPARPPIARTNAAPPQAGPAAAPPSPLPAAASVAPQAISDVDVEAILTGLAAKSDHKLNWRTSIVDLMKLLDLDSRLAERKGLAAELGYGGALDGSADMNVWLHKRVMRELAANGGKVPATLMD